MAKLKGPLFSLGATQQLGKALVYFPWKGLNLVREYVIPANPQTTLQTTQRGYVTAAVAAIHTAQGLTALPLDSDDQVAYSALASAKGLIMTWFNQAVKLWLDVKVAGKVPIVYRDGNAGVVLPTDFRPNVNFTEETGSTLAAGKMYLGTSRTNLNKSKAATIVAGSSAYLADGEGFDDLTDGIKYYWQFRPDAGDGCVGADSGIYYDYAAA